MMEGSNEMLMGEKPHQLLPNMACCMCGIPMQPNPSRMCVNCLRNQVDVTEGISRQLVVQRCKGCTRWSKPPFVHCEPESRELLALCLKKVKGLNRVRLVDASFLWTEPNSKRLKVRLTVQKEIVHGAILQQNAVIDFIIQIVQCDDCKKSFTPHSWNANVQVRQKVDHKRSLLFLEQLILKNDAHERVINIEENNNGLDFQFTAKQHAEKFSDFVSAVFPVKKTYSKQLVSHDAKCNTYYHKYTINLELCPICKDDLVFLPPKVASNYGGVSTFLLCHKVSTAVHLIDPITLRFLDIPVEKYWKSKFDAVLTRRHLTDFVVLDVEYKSFGEGGGGAANGVDGIKQQQSVVDGSEKGRPFCHQASRAGKFRVAQVEIARVADFGVNDQRIVVSTHLGNVLRPGDYCQGYDLRTINMPDLQWREAAEKMQTRFDVILVKKVRPPGKPVKSRKWLLQCLPKETDVTMGVRKDVKQRHAADMEEFMRDLEEDAEMRKEVNLWKDPRIAQSEVLSEDEFGNIDIAELLEGLTLDDPEEVVKPHADAGEDVEMD